MFRYRKITKFAQELEDEIKLIDIEKRAISDEEFASSIPSNLAIDFHIEKRSSNQGQEEKWQSDKEKFGVPIKELADFIVNEKKKDWDKDKLVQEIKDCADLSIVGFLEKTPYTHWKYQDFVRVSAEGRKATSFFWGWLYCLNLSIKKYGEVKAIVLTIILSAVFWLFAKSLYNSFAPYFNWPKIQ